MIPELEHYISHIEGLTELHLSLLKEMLQADGGKLFGLDILAAGVVKRSMSLCAGFATLVRDENYTSAAALLRLQLDTCLRFYGAFIVENPHEFAAQVMRGVPIRKMKDRNGKLMTDRYLVDQLGKKYEWMPRVYEATSGFIHLSDRHVFAAWGPGEESNGALLLVGAKDGHFAEELWIEMSSGFLSCTDALFEYLKGWVYTKQNPEVVRRIAEQKV